MVKRIVRLSGLGGGMLRLPLAGALLAAILSFGLPAIAGTLQNSLIAQAEAVDEHAYAFTRTLRAEDETDTKIIVERFDPRVRTNGGWTLVSIDGREPNGKEREEASKRYAAAHVPGYPRIVEWVGQPATETAEGLSYASFAKDTFEVGPADVSRKMAGVARLARHGDRVWVDQARFHLTKPMRIMLVAKLDRMEIVTDYRLLPGGDPVIARQVFDMRGSIPGRSGTQRTVMTYSDYRRVGA